MGGRTSECDRDRPPATRIAGRPVVGRGEGDGDGFWPGARLRSVWPRRAGRPRTCCQPSAEYVVWRVSVTHHRGGPHSRGGASRRRFFVVTDDYPHRVLCGGGGGGDGGSGGGGLDGGGLQWSEKREGWQSGQRFCLCAICDCYCLFFGCLCICFRCWCALCMFFLRRRGVPAGMTCWGML